MGKGVVYDIKRFAIHDGPGIRTTVFFKGCPCDCWWCHNPESRSGEIFKYTKKLSLDGVSIERDQVVGEVMTVDQLMLEIEKDNVFYAQSGGGVTFSGGEPLLQMSYLKAMLARCKAKGIHTALDTTAYCDYSEIEQIVDDVDLFMIDLKFIDDDLHRKYVGLSNRNVLSNIGQLLEMKKHVWIRIPVIPNVNTLQMDKIIDFLNGIKAPDQVNLLPYHKIGKHKYQQFGIAYRLDGIEEPDDMLMQSLKQKFQKIITQVEIGG